MNCVKLELNHHFYFILRNCINCQIHPVCLESPETLSGFYLFWCMLFLMFLLILSWVMEDQWTLIFSTRPDATLCIHSLRILSQDEPQTASTLILLCRLPSSSTGVCSLGTKWKQMGQKGAGPTCICPIGNSCFCCKMFCHGLLLCALMNTPQITGLQPMDVLWHAGTCIMVN